MTSTELIGTPSREVREEFVSVAEMQNRIMPDPHQLTFFGSFDIYGMTLPTRVVGGDFYDFVDVEGSFQKAGKLGLVIADASGHGLSAAMLIRDFNTALYTAISFQLQYEGDTTAVLFEKLNRRMFHSSLPHQFITAFYAELHLSGKVRYINAGHLPPLLWNGEKIVSLDTGGPVLGAICDLSRPYEVGEVWLEEGDCLVCFTDGIVEATDPSGHEFGLQRLQQAIETHEHLAARHLFNAILQEVTSFSRTTQQGDDWTLLVVKHGASEQT